MLHSYHKLSFVAIMWNGNVKLDYTCCITGSGKNLSTLNCVLSRRRKTPPNLPLLRMRTRTEINHNSGRAPTIQLGNMLSTLPPLHSLGLLPPPLCAQLTTSHTLSSRQGPTHPSTPFVYEGLRVRPLASVCTFGDNACSQTEVRMKHVFTSVHEFPWLWRKPHSKFSVFQCGQVEKCRHTVPACPPGCL